jgi:hypothetical protein
MWIGVWGAGAERGGDMMHGGGAIGEP